MTHTSVCSARGTAVAAPTKSSLRMLVRRIVVHHQMHVDLRRHLPINLRQKAEELLTAMPLLAVRQHFPRRHIQGREPRRAVSDIIVSIPFRRSQSKSHRQDRLAAFQRLNLRRLVDAQHSA